MALSKHWLCPSNTTRYLCRTNLAASCDCYVKLSLSRTVPVESDRHRRVVYFSHALQALFVCRDRRATIAHVAHVTWTYLVPRLPSHNCACFACYESLLCCDSPDGRTHVDARYARACTRVDCGELFMTLKSHHNTTFVNNFIWLYILFDCVVWHHIFIYIAKWF
jgi:hypothetical protein